MKSVVAALALAAVIGVTANAEAQAYKYGGRVDYGAQSYKQKSFFKSGTGTREKENSFAGGRNAKANVFGGYVPLKSYKQRSFLPQEALPATDDGQAASTAAPPSAPAKSTPLKKEQTPRLTRKDFNAPKTDGGKSPFDRYEIAVPPRPQIKN